MEINYKEIESNSIAIAILKILKNLYDRNLTTVKRDN